MRELIADLEALPQALQGEASKIVEAHANSAAVEIRGAYPVREGGLRNGVKVVVGSALVRRVLSVARHAHLYERGSVRRITGSGANRGTMPAANVFIPRVIRARARMVGALIALVERSKVRGMTGTLEVVERGD